MQLIKPIDWEDTDKNECGRVFLHLHMSIFKSEVSGESINDKSNCVFEQIILLLVSR